MATFNPADPEFWSQSAKTYAAQSEPFTGLFAADALALTQIGPGVKLLDVAAGTGAASALAAAAGAEVLATDFSPGMIDAIEAQALPGVTARVMNGEALALADASFDVTVSIFGVMLFPDWRAGLREMARVTRPGGAGVIATWKHPFGAATSLLLAEMRAELFPDSPGMKPFGGMEVLRDPERLTAEMEAAGFGAVHVAESSHDFRLKLGPDLDVETLFGFSPHWEGLNADQRTQVMTALAARIARDRQGDVLPIPSTALIARGTRR